MKGIYEEIRKETRISMSLSELALDSRCDKSQGTILRAEQDKHYKKAQFLKEFCKARNKIKGEENEKN